MAVIVEWAIVVQENATVTTNVRAPAIIGVGVPRQIIIIVNLLVPLLDIMLLKLPSVVQVFPGILQQNNVIQRRLVMTPMAITSIPMVIVLMLTALITISAVVVMPTIITAAEVIAIQPLHIVLMVAQVENAILLVNQMVKPVLMGVNVLLAIV
jgi:hypothetical protein